MMKHTKWVSVQTLLDELDEMEEDWDSARYHSPARSTAGRRRDGRPRSTAPERTASPTAPRSS